MSSDAARIRAAAARYGHLVDHIAGRYTNPVTGKRLSGAALLLKIAQGESSALTSDKARTDVSPAGARGWLQFMPSSRAVAIQKYGVDPWRTPEEAVRAATLHLRGKINGKTGLEGYNPGSSSYPNYILGQRVGATHEASGSGGAPAPARSGGASPAVSGSSAMPSFDVVGAPAQQVQQQVVASPLQAPAFAAGPVMPAGYQAPVTGGGPLPAQQQAEDPLDALPTEAQVLGGGAEFELPDVSLSGESPASGGATAPGTRVKGAVRGSPVPGQKPQRSTHDTDGLSGYPAYDYMAPAGKSVVAPVGGKVIRISGKDPKAGGAPGGALGYSVYLRGDDGKTYFLTHIDRVRPKVGAKVRQGQKIAVIANGPSSWSTPHVHMGIKG